MIADELRAFAEDLLRLEYYEGQLQKSFERGLALADRVEAVERQASAMESWAKEGETILNDEGSLGWLFWLGRWWGDRPWRIRNAGAPPKPSS